MTTFSDTPPNPSEPDPLTGRVTPNDLFEVPIERNLWADYVVRPAILVLMILCLNIAVVQVVQLINPAWRGWYFLLGTSFVTIEGIYSTYVWLRRRGHNFSGWRYRLVELGMLAIVLKLITYIGKDWAFIVADLSLLGTDPSAIVTQEYLALLFLAGVSWLFAVLSVIDFEALYDPLTFSQPENVPILNLSQRFFWGGVLIMLTSGVARIVAVYGVDGLTTLNRANLGGVVFNVLVYFALGLVLLSQVQLASLNTSWQLQRLKVAPDLAVNWLRFGVIVLGGVALLVFILPTGYTIGLLDSLRLMLNVLINAVFYLLQFLLFIFVLPFMLMSRALDDPSADLPPPEPLISPPAAPPMPPMGDAPLLEILRSFLFWFVSLSLIFYFLHAYLLDHWDLLARLRRVPGWAWVSQKVNWLWQGLLSLFKTAVQIIPRPGQPKSSTQNIAQQAKSAWQWPRLRGLSPRQKIMYYYFNTLTRAKRQGLPRQQNETPREFAPHLSQSVPQAAQEVDLLTEAFIKARYANPKTQQWDEEHARLSETLWRKIRTELRQAKKQNRPPDP